MDQKILRKADVYFKNDLAGYLSETNEGYIFQYDEDFLKKNIPISVSLPPREEPYRSADLFPFFKGLLPEGWYLDIVSTKLKRDPRDSFGILASTASTGTIGAVTIHQAEQ
ncbi:MAG: HipA N-terminal domain-containing protein [Candidatus Omnitrophota bacterium]|nr:HipA N-terminal domain-containing protein [Candidatus Omnitrophota bacterium]